ncbi:acylphosphatase [Granulibacter bethesdensis]|uniref:acylphosphatase n=1 Tax=Granulibacter bethesdensis TaxID=364410 RepID=UPI00090C69FF|nr:acylphosphatase [Granulibacter bethesdensis]APH58901.1 Acylphosphatase [Granulibacter bethesdensis]
MSAKHVLISGVVQGVGYRAWLRSRAEALGLSGWVRNRLDGRVEALIAGDIAAVEKLIRACRTGPSAARVDRIEEHLDTDPITPGFEQYPTV